MKKVLLGLLVVSISVIGVFAQPNGKETDELRKQINLSKKENIRQNKDENFPAGQVLKLYLAVNYNKSSKRSFEKRIEDWNAENGDKYGKFEIVDKIEDADLAVAQFVSKRGKFVEEEFLTIGNIPRQGELKPKLRVEAGRDFERISLPVHSYLLVRTNDIWNIVYHEVETSSYGDQIYNPDISLWNEIKDKMENR